MEGQKTGYDDLYKDSPFGSDRDEDKKVQAPEQKTYGKGDKVRIKLESGDVDDDWEIKEITDDGTVKLKKTTFKQGFPALLVKEYSLNDIAEWNKGAEETKEAEKPEKEFKKGDTITIKVPSSGEMEEGWGISAVRENGNVIVRKDTFENGFPGLRETLVTLDEIKEWNKEESVESTEEPATEAPEKSKNTILDIVQNNRIKELGDSDVLREVLGLPEEFTEEEKELKLKEFEKQIAENPELASRQMEIASAISPETLKNLKSKETKEAEAVGEKLDRDYEKYVQRLNEKVEKKGFWQKHFDRYLKNAPVRMAFGVATGLAVAATQSPSMRLASMLVRTGLASFGFGTAAEAGKMARIQKESVSSFADCKGQDGKYDKDKTLERFRQLSPEKRDRVIAGLMETSERRSEQISEEIYEKEQKEIAEAESKRKWPRIKFDELRNNFSKLSTMKKLAIGAAVALVSTGAGVAAGVALGGAAVAGGFSLAGAGSLLSAGGTVWGVGVSGLIGISSGAIMSTREKMSTASEHSELTNILGNEYFQSNDFDPKELQNARKQVGKEIVGSRKRGIALGVVVANAALIISSGAKAIGIHAGGEVVPHHAGEKAGGKVEPDNIPTEQLTKDPTLHVKDTYFAKGPDGKYLHIENVGPKADKHLAEIILNEYKERTGGHFNSHSKEFEVARDYMAKQWEEKGYFNPDGSLKVDPAELKYDINAIGEAKAALTETVPEYFNSLGEEKAKQVAEHSTGGHGKDVLEQRASQSEATSKEELLKSTGAEVPPTWKMGQDFSTYNNGKPITESGVMDMLNGKQISKDSSNYIHKLFEVDALKAENIHVSADGKQLMINMPNSEDKDIVWSAGIKDKSIFSGLFSGRTVDAKSILPEEVINNNTNHVLGNYETKPPDRLTHPSIGGTEQPAHPNGPITDSGEKFYKVEDATTQGATDSSGGEKTYVSVDDPDQTPIPEANSGVGEAAPEVVISQDIPYSADVLQNIDSSKNYMVNIQGQEPLSVPGSRLNQLVEEAKKYLVEHHLEYPIDSPKGNQSINLYVLEQLNPKPKE